MQIGSGRVYRIQHRMKPPNRSAGAVLPGYPHLKLDLSAVIAKLEDRHPVYAYPVKDAPT